MGTRADNGESCKNSGLKVEDHISHVGNMVDLSSGNPIGELSQNGQFEFIYNNEVQEAIEDGFELLIAFPEIDKLYISDKLFPVFASRLPDPKRKGIEDILEKYGLAEYDAYTFLKRSGAR